MAEINSGNGGGTGGDGNNGGNQLRDEVEPQRSQIVDQTAEGAPSGTGAAATSDDRGGDGHAAKIGCSGDRRTPVP